MLFADGPTNRKSSRQWSMNKAPFTRANQLGPSVSFLVDPIIPFSLLYGAVGVNEHVLTPTNSSC